MGAHLLECLHAIASLKELVATCAQTVFDDGTIDVYIINDQDGGTRGLHATSLRPYDNRYTPGLIGNGGQFLEGIAAECPCRGMRALLLHPLSADFSLSQLLF
jgi:hypothetical protein